MVVDVRSPEEYAAGHVEGALNVPLDTLGRSRFVVAAPMTETESASDVVSRSSTLKADTHEELAPPSQASIHPHRDPNPIKPNHPVPLTTNINPRRGPIKHDHINTSRSIDGRLGTQPIKHDLRYCMIHTNTTPVRSLSTKPQPPINPIERLDGMSLREAFPRVERQAC